MVSPREAIAGDAARLTLGASSPGPTYREGADPAAGHQHGGGQGDGGAQAGHLAMMNPAPCRRKRARRRAASDPEGIPGTYNPG